MAEESAGKELVHVPRPTQVEKPVGSKDVLSSTLRTELEDYIVRLEPRTGPWAAFMDEVQEVNTGAMLRSPKQDTHTEIDLRAREAHRDEYPETYDDAWVTVAQLKNRIADYVYAESVSTIADPDQAYSHYARTVADVFIDAREKLIIRARDRHQNFAPRSQDPIRHV